MAPCIAGWKRSRWIRGGMKGQRYILPYGINTAAVKTVWCLYTYIYIPYIWHMWGGISLYILRTCTRCIWAGYMHACHPYLGWVCPGSFVCRFFMRGWIAIPEAQIHVPYGTLRFSLVTMSSTITKPSSTAFTMEWSSVSMPGTHWKYSKRIVV